MAIHFANLIGFTKARIFPLLMVNFIGALGYSVILPFLVFLVKDFGGDEVMYGLIASVYPAFQMIGAPWLGAQSDKVGRKLILLVSQAGTFLSWVIFLVAFAVPKSSVFSMESGTYGTILLTLPLLVLVFARMLDGLTGGNISVANAYLADISNDKNRKANFGLMSSAMNLGFVIGPMVSGLLTALPNGRVLTVALAALVSLVGIFIIYFYLPETKNEGVIEVEKSLSLKRLFSRETNECFDQGGKQGHTKTSVLSVKGVPFMTTLYFLIFLGFNVMYATWPLHSSKGLGWSPAQLGLFFALIGIALIIVQGPVMSYLSDKMSEETLFTIGSLILVGMFLTMTLQNDIILYANAILFGLGNGLMWPSFLSLLSRLGNRNQQGAIQGLGNSAGSLASIIGLIAGGFLYGSLGHNVFMLSAGLFFLIFLLGMRFVAWSKKELSPTS